MLAVIRGRWRLNAYVKNLKALDAFARPKRAFYFGDYMNDVIRLYCNRRQTQVAVVRDAKYPQMWGVRWPDGTLSDMVNVARAKDAAFDYAEGVEARKNRHQSPLKLLANFSWSGPPVRFPGWQVPQAPSAPDKRISEAA